MPRQAMSDTDLDVSSFESLEAEPRGPDFSGGEETGEEEEETGGEEEEEEGTDGGDEREEESEGEEGREVACVPARRVTQPRLVLPEPEPEPETRPSPVRETPERTRSAIDITLPLSRQPSEDGDRGSLASSFVSVAESRRSSADRQAEEATTARQQPQQPQQPQPEQPRQPQKPPKPASKVAFESKLHKYLHPMAAASPGRSSSSGTEITLSSGEEEEEEESGRETRSVAFTDESSRKSPRKTSPTKKPAPAKTTFTRPSRPGIEIVVSRPGPSKFAKQSSLSKSRERRKSETFLMPVEKRRRLRHIRQRKRRSKSGSSSEARSSDITSGEEEEESKEGGRKKKKVKRKKSIDKKKKKKMTLLELEAETKGVLKGKSKKKKKKKKKTELNIDIEGVVKFSDGEFSDAAEIEPPANLSPRSAAEYVKVALKKAAARRKKKKRKKDEKDGTGKKKKKKKKGKKGKKKRKKRKKREGSEDEGPSEGELRRAAPAQEHYYPTPQMLRKKRCAFVSEAKPVICSICDGIHYRTKRNFAQNLKIIININKALTIILSDMRNRMKKIDLNLERVKKNLEYMEDMYEGVFRRVNRLIVK